MTTIDHRPRLSVVIPAYNSAHMISQSIESVLAQSRPVDEIIVIDDGSTDDTARVVAGFADRGVRCLRQANQGISRARNRGIAETTGELIAFLDHDDLWLPTMIAECEAQLLAQPAAMLVACRRWWWDPATDRRWLLPELSRKVKNLRREIVIDNLVGGASQVLLRRQVLDQVGLFESAFDGSEDWELWIRIAMAAPIILYAQPLVIYRSQATNFSKQQRWQYLNRAEAIGRRAIEDYLPPWSRLPLRLRLTSHWHLYRAHYAVEHGFPRHQSLWYATRSLVADPTRDLSEKLGACLRALGGEGLYQPIRRLVRRRSAEPSRLPDHA